MCDQIVNRMNIDQPETDEQWIQLKNDLLQKSEQMSVNCINLHRNDIDCRHFCQTDPMSKKCTNCLSDPRMCNLMLRIDMLNMTDNPLNADLFERPCCGNIEEGLDCVSCLRNASTAGEIKMCTLRDNSSWAWWIYLLITCGVLTVVVLVIVTVVRTRRNMTK